MEILGTVCALIDAVRPVTIQTLAQALPMSESCHIVSDLESMPHLRLRAACRHMKMSFAKINFGYGILA